VALRLMTHLVEGLTLEFPDIVPVESAPGARAEIGITGIGVSCAPSKSGTCEMKLSRACSSNK
jgi:hypothetical protein